jgi:uncharacterized protein with GYD domain
MSTYIMLIDYTDQGIRDVKASPKRADAARDLAKTCGCEIKELYLTIGSHDLVATFEAPNDEAIAKFALKIGSLGNVRTNTLKAFTEGEYRTIIESLP